ncbi:MAG TPA: hypothetical protein VGP30_05445 [Candidatus Limnocylindrales bacterium]|nr:hypothetical protein [Candidatus Limnocylindrales bacterium]
MRRVKDRPRRQQEDRALSRAEHLVEDPDAVALDVAISLGMAGPHVRPPAVALQRLHTKSVVASAIAPELAVVATRMNRFMGAAL